MLVVYALFLVIVPISHPSYYAFMTCLIGTIVSLVCIYLMYTYLGSTPDHQQTITNSLHMFHLVLCVLYGIREAILSFFFNLMNASAKKTFESNPTIMCSLSSDRLIVMPASLAYFLIVMSKLYMTIYPLHFLGLDHKLLGRLAIAITIFLPALDSVIRLLLLETICNGVYLETRLIESYGLNIPADIGEFMVFPWAMFLAVSG